MNTWIAGKDLMKHHYQIKNIFYSELNLEHITDKDYHYQIKNIFYSELNLEDITDKDYAHAQKLFEELKLKPW